MSLCGRTPYKGQGMIESNLKQRLEVLRGTLRRAMTLNGLGRLAVAFVGCFLLAVLLDYFIFRWDRPINTVFRSLMLLGVLGTLGWIAYYKLVAPLSVPLNRKEPFSVGSGLTLTCSYLASRPNFSEWEPITLEKLSLAL